MAKIDGKDVITEISVDGTTWKTLICETEGGFDFSREFTEAPRTKCDTAETGKVKTPAGYTWNMTFDAIADNAPTSGQVSYADIQGYAVAGTLLHVRQQNAASDAEVYQEGTAYIESLSSAHPVEDKVTFSGSFAGTGDIDIVQA